MRMAGQLDLLTFKRHAAFCTASDPPRGPQYLKQQRKQLTRTIAASAPSDIGRRCRTMSAMHKVATTVAKDTRMVATCCKRSQSYAQWNALVHLDIPLSPPLSALCLLLGVVGLCVRIEAIVCSSNSNHDTSSNSGGSALRTYIGGTSASSIGQKPRPAPS